MNTIERNASGQFLEETMPLDNAFLRVLAEETGIDGRCIIGENRSKHEGRLRREMEGVQGNRSPVNMSAVVLEAASLLIADPLLVRLFNC